MLDGSSMSSLAKFVDWAHNATFYIRSDSNKDVIIKYISVAVSIDKTTRIEDWPGWLQASSCIIKSWRAVAPLVE